MAKKRTVEADVVETAATQPENMDVLEDAPTEIVAASEQTEVSETPKEVKEPKKGKTAKADIEIPEYAKDLLKVFNRYPELYISKDGGVYVPGTKLPANKGAILYKNPFYNS